MSVGAPKGFGMFIWQPAQCEHGNWNAIIAKAQRSNLSWLVLHEFWTPAIVAKLKTAGFYVVYSFASYPGPTVTSQVDAGRAARSAGCDAIFFDAETAWETGPDGKTPAWRGAEATAFMKELRDAVGEDCWLGDAGAWQWPKFHPDYPDREFAAFVDGALPERYWTEFRPSVTYAQAIAESEKEWASYTDVQGYKSVIPIGSAFGTNGPVPGGHQPLVESDLRDFLTRYSTCALWSWMHVPAFGWDVLESFGAAG